MKNWKIKTNDNRISLHDCIISCENSIKGIVFHFDEGFNVLKENEHNNTGQHKTTGESLLLLKNSTWISCITESSIVTMHNKTIQLEPKEIPFQEILAYKMEIMSYEIALENNIVKVEVLIQGFYQQETSNYATITIQADELVFCWNEFVADAWFQD